MDIWQVSLAALAVFSGALIQSGIGFGYALVVAPVLMLLNPDWVPAPVIMSALFLTSLVAGREWREIQWRLVGRILLGFLPGLAVGAWLLAGASSRQMAVIFGVLTLGAVAMSALGLQPALRLRNVLLAGVCSGVMNVTTSMGGPPLAIVLQSLPGAALRGTLAATFGINGSLSLLTLVVVGRFGGEALQVGVLSLPFVLLGFLASRGLSRWLDRGRVRAAVLTLAGGAGVFVLLRGVMGW
ncbi:MAG: sulfite exporter TauE/SafE family protein [Magnetococcus sp. WYHC-3]